MHAVPVYAEVGGGGEEGRGHDTFGKTSGAFVSGRTILGSKYFLVTVGLEWPMSVCGSPPAAA